MSLPATNTLLLKQSGARLYVTLNRPERRNAMNNQMNQELHELADCLSRSESIRVVILQGAGGHFCAGGDIKERKEQTDSSTEGVDPARERNIKSGQLFKKILAFTSNADRGCRRLSHGWRFWPGLYS
jgi:Enoyl-CoA hydratase/carnithine racemase